MEDVVLSNAKDLHLAVRRNPHPALRVNHSAVHLVSGCVMLATLKTEKLMNGVPSRAVCCSDAEFAATRELTKRVPDRQALLRHDNDAWYHLHMNEFRCAEIARCECLTDAVEVCANGVRGNRVLRDTLEVNASTVG